MVIFCGLFYEATFENRFFFLAGRAVAFLITIWVVVDLVVAQAPDVAGMSVSYVTSLVAMVIT